ncbi:MFS transporter [Leucobacter luti]|uniref:MFS transporter n=1 Tax=Leucobacter luti TaxID=340320 RepID=UPI001C690D2F|nr:MFS transporter [Leucobacter luti]QYM76127.1 MFS transporter [Leucobacter luti]
MSVTTPSPRGTARTAPQVPLLLTAVFLAFLGQTTLNPIIAPLSREVGLAEWQVGVTISAAAVMVVGTSQFWGRRSQSWGRKPVLVTALALATVTMLLFALLAEAGFRGLITGGLLFTLFILLRGVGFGTAIAAVGPTAQAYIADVTLDEAARVKGMSGVGAVQGIAMVAGAIVGGTLSTLGLIAPLIAVPVLLALALAAVLVGLRRESRSELVPAPARIRPSDPRVWPFLVTGFGMFTALGFIQVITGFIVQDRLGLTAGATGALTGAALLAAGAGMIVAQGVIVPRSGWSPATLLRVGCPSALVGFLLLIPNAGVALLMLALLIIGLGIGTAMPGYTAGPTLLMRREEQGGLAGLVGATNGLTFVIAPTASTLLYSFSAPLPVITGALILSAVCIFVFWHPMFRTPEPGALRTPVVN